jgi:hypothetical protein
VASVNDNRLRNGNGRGRGLRPGKAGTEKSENKPTHITTELHSNPQEEFALADYVTTLERETASRRGSR